MILQPPRYTLFPCTTLFRSVARHAQVLQVARARVGRLAEDEDAVIAVVDERRQGVATEIRAHRGGVEAPDLEECSGRSEEHTSELQSRHYFVCRLLLVF